MVGYSPISISSARFRRVYPWGADNLQEIGTILCPWPWFARSALAKLGIAAHSFTRWGLQKKSTWTNTPPGRDTYASNPIYNPASRHVCMFVYICVYILYLAIHLCQGSQWAVYSTYSMQVRWMGRAINSHVGKYT